MSYGLEHGVVSTAWLAAHLDAVKPIDASFFPPGVDRDPEREFLDGRVPGAVRFSIDRIADADSALPHMLPHPEAFAAAAGALGITETDTVIAYDSVGIMGAARAWWMLRALGHRGPVAVLDGGLPKWRAEARPLRSGPPDPPASATYAAARAGERVRDLDQVRDRPPGTALLDARDPGRFDGTAPEIWPGRRQGHIPGAVNLPFATLLSADKTLVPPDAIRAAFAARGVAHGQPVIASCGSGVTACVLALAAHAAGLGDVAVYDGSWAEWGLADGPPIETGPGGDR